MFLQWRIPQSGRPGPAYPSGELARQGGHARVKPEKLSTRSHGAARLTEPQSRKPRDTTFIMDKMILEDTAKYTIPMNLVAPMMRKVGT